MPTTPTIADWRTALGFSGVGLVVVLILWLAGFIGSFWAGLGVLAIGNMFLAAAYLPKWRKTSICLAVVWTLVVVVKPIVWNSLPPMVQDALSSRSGAESTRFSETVRGHGGDAMTQLALYCSEREKQYTDGVEKLRGIIHSLDPNDPNRPKQEAELQQRVRNIEAWRQKCTQDMQYEGATVRAAVTSFITAVASAFHPDSPQKWYDLLGILLLVGFGFYCAKWDKLSWGRAVGGAMLLAFVFFLGRYVLFETNLTKPIQEMWALATRELTPEEKEEHRKRAEQARALAAITPVPSSPNPLCTFEQTTDGLVFHGSQLLRSLYAANGCKVFYFKQSEHGGLIRLTENPCSRGGVPFFKEVGMGSSQVWGYVDSPGLVPGSQWPYIDLDSSGTRVEWTKKTEFVDLKKGLLNPLLSIIELSCVS